MIKIEEHIPQKTKTHLSKLVKPIIPLARPEKDKLDALEYIDHTCHNTPEDTTSGEYNIQILRFDSGTPEEWIIFVGLVQKSLVGLNVTTGPPMYKCIKRVQKGDAKAEFLLQANLVGSCTVANFTTVMVTMTVHFFPAYAYCDQRQYMQRYLDGPIHSMVEFFQTRIEYLEKSIPPSVPSRNGKNPRKGPRKRKE